jgi:hypothetical protein
MPLCATCTLIDVKALTASFAIPVQLKPSFAELEIFAQAGCPLCQLVKATKATIEETPESGNSGTLGKAVYYSAVGNADPQTKVLNLNALLVSCMGRSSYRILAPNKIPIGESPRL